MRIAQIMLAKGFGGAERSFVDLCGALTARGQEVLAIAETGATALPYLEEIDHLTISRVTVRGVWDVFVKRKIAAQLRTFAPDIVQLHLARAAYLGGSAARAQRMPTIAKTHNYVNLKYYRAIDHLVPTTKKQRDYLRDAGIPDAQITLIPNFSRVAGAHQREQTRAGTALRIVAIGRLVYKKGFDILLRALHRATRRGLQCRAVIVGGGEETAALKTLCSELALDDVVEFAGWQRDIAAYLSHADVCVLPSRDEPFGIVCLEAMALTVPMIASRSDGPLEVLDEETAILVACEDIDGFADALCAVARAPASAARRAEKALVRFKQRYSEEAVVAQYLALYTRLQRATTHSHDPSAL